MSCDEWPGAVTFHTASGALELAWDGAVALLSGATLRTACRCAGCESARRLGGQRPDHAGVLLTHIEILGSAGLHCTFSDGHERGIYPWPYLRALSLASLAKPPKHPHIQHERTQP